MKRLLVMTMGVALMACSSVYVPKAHVESIKASIRSASVKGFIDVNIDYVKPDLIVSGHAYSSLYISRLMKEMTEGGAKNLRLQEVHADNMGGRRVTSFTVVEAEIGNIRNWNGPISLKYPFPDHSLAPPKLAGHSLKELAFVGVIFDAYGTYYVLIKEIEGRIHRMRIGDRISSENAKIEEYTDHSLILQMADGQKQEITLSVE